MSTNDLPHELSQTVLVEIRAQFKRLKWQCDTWQRADWRLTLDQYVAMWAPRWRDRRRDNLVLLRVDESGAYEVGNVYIDTRTNQIKRQWALYRRQVERPKPGDDALLSVKCDETHIIREEPTI
jgi:hypothetical protein